jgi:ketosteroid isomerase-like protein
MDYGWIHSIICRFAPKSCIDLIYKLASTLSKSIATLYYAARGPFMKIRSTIAIFSLFLTLVLPLQAGPAAAGSENAGIQAFLQKFLAAFDNLDWPAFADCFSDSATVFYPAPPNLRRTDSRGQFEKAWLGVFERIKKESGRSSPPYMQLKPEDLQIEILADGAALVTFHLTNGNILSRRTLVLKKFALGWKIVHIHASNLPVS